MGASDLNAPSPVTRLEDFPFGGVSPTFPPLFCVAVAARILDGGVGRDVATFEDRHTPSFARTVAHAASVAYFSFSLVLVTR